MMIFVGSAWQKNGFHEGFYKEDVKMIVAKNLEGKLTLIKGDSILIFPGIRAFIGSETHTRITIPAHQYKKRKRNNRFG